MPSFRKQVEVPANFMEHELGAMPNQVEEALAAARFLQPTTAVAPVEFSRSAVPVMSRSMRVFAFPEGEVADALPQTQSAGVGINGGVQLTMPETAGMDVLGGGFSLLADEPKVGEGQENKEEDVKKLQEALKKLGYDPGPIDGKWGKKTSDALKKFQEDKKLKKVDGIAGPETWDAINNALAELEGVGEDKGAKPAKPGDVERVKTLNELLKELEEKMTKEQKERYKKLEEEKINKLLQELEDALKKWGASSEEENGGGGGSIFSAEDKAKWNTEENVQDLALLIAGEAGGENDEAKTAVGYTALNRMKRNGKNRVKDVAGAYHGYKVQKKKKDEEGEDPPASVVELARRMLRCDIADNSGGATHFYSPQSMPKEGDESQPEGTKPRDLYDGSDTSGGLEQVPGMSRRNYRPGWSTKYPEVKVKGVEQKKFKFYKAPGSGPVR